VSGLAGGCRCRLRWLAGWASALAGLGRCALAAGHADQAGDMLRQALEIFQRIGAAETAEVSAELQAITDGGPAAQGS